MVATTTQIADFARVVGGPDVEVHQLLAPNVDAHDFEPSPADLDALARADVILANGLGLEPWLGAAVRSSGTHTAVTVTSAGANIRHRDGSPDPHLWFDPTNAQTMVGHVADAIAAADPTHGEAIRSRARAYDAQLVTLDRWIAARIATIDQPKLVTDHDAFGYYVARYHLSFVGSIIPSFDSAAEVSPASLDRLAQRVRAQQVPAVFTERSLPPRAAQALARKAGVEVVTGDQGLYGDSLGPSGSDGGTYLKMMRHNTTSIVTHLGAKR